MVDDLLRHQQEIETGEITPLNGIGSFAYATANISGHFFRQAGVVAGLRDELPKLEELGFAIGNALYLTDAAEDLRQDIAKDRFNPFCAKMGSLVPIAELEAKMEAAGSWQLVLDASSQLPFSELMRNDLTARVNKIISQISGTCYTNGCAGHAPIRTSKKVAAAITASLVPSVLMAESQRSSFSFDDCCAGCCAFMIIIYCITCTPKGAADCACCLCCGPTDKYKS